MNIKKIGFVFLIVLSLILCISAVSASDDVNSTDITVEEQTDVVEQNVSPTTDESQSEPQTDTQDQPTKTTAKKIATDVEADDVAVEYKKNNYFKIKVENKKTDKPLKNIKVKLKVFTKTKSKTYTLKTNSKGIAIFNTKILKSGSHKVIITSADDKYKISKKANIYVGKKTSTTLKINSKKAISKKDVIRVYTKSDDDEKDIKIAYKGASKNSKILKAVFYFKNKLTGKIVKKVDKADFDDGRWDLPEEDYKPWIYTPVKVLLWYLKY